MSNSDSIIDALLRAGHNPISGEELAHQLGISRTTVWKNIRNLSKEGYHIEVRKGKGYRLIRMTSRPLEREIKRGLSTKLLGKKVLSFERLPSTNDKAKELARLRENEGTIVIAGEQTGGRGRLGRSWISPKGGMYMTIILQPDIPIESLPKLTLLIGLAVVRAVNGLYSLSSRVKWPNDILIDGKKVGGILCEMEGEAEKINFVAVGIGIDANCHVTVDRPTTSLKKELGRDVDINSLIRRVVEEIEPLYTGLLEGNDSFLKEYLTLSHTVGREVRIDQAGKTLEGIAETVDKDGALILRLPDGSTEKVYSGECQYIR